MNRRSTVTRSAKPYPTLQPPHRDATSHAELDADTDVQEEVRNVARALALAVHALRAGRLMQADAALDAPRPKWRRLQGK